MKKIKGLLAVLAIGCLMTSCTSENYSNGEKIGLVTKMQQQGIIWKSWEGHLNLTQTGMNSSNSAPFDFSLDNDHFQPEVLATLDSAAERGWKVKLTYHETYGLNWWGNRGHTDFFVTSVEVVDKNLIQNAMNGYRPTDTTVGYRHGHVIDTIYVVIYREKP